MTVGIGAWWQAAAAERAEVLEMEVNALQRQVDAPCALPQIEAKSKHEAARE